MATNPLHVNKESTRVEKPGVTINGKQIDSDGVIIANEDWTPSRNDIEQLGKNFTNVAERVFYVDSNDWVTITLTPDTKFPTNSYGLDRDHSFDGNQIGPRAFQGAQQVVNNSLGLSSDTYYTLNGKNPKRTKTNLYTGPFVLRRNTSGSDNIILKARTYRAGQWSEIRTVEIRIARKVDTKV